MNIGDKLMLFIYLIALTCLSIFLIVMPFGGVTFNWVQNAVYSMFNTYKWYCFVVGILLTALNLRLVFGLIFGQKSKQYGVVKYTSSGEINVSYDTIKSLVYRTVSTIRGIKDINVMIRPGKENIKILIKILILPDINIPDVVREIQESAKSYIEETAEVPVGEVKVIVKDVASSTKLRVE